jgi:two-component system sensor histidine kinase MprB
LLVETDLRPCLVLVDPAAVDRAVSNLLDNALKWNAPDAPIHVTVTDGQLVVSDCGPGIDPADLPHVFERFYRAPEARAMPGAGLGLAIVRGVADAHGATVGVRSGPGGSTFTLAFTPIGFPTEP